MRRTKVHISTVIFISVIMCIVSSMGTYFFLNNKMLSYGKTQQGHEDILSKLMKIDELVVKKYISKIDAKKLTDGIIFGYMGSLDDKYGTYLDRLSYKGYTGITSFYIENIGISVDYQNNADGIYVTSVYKSSPADKCGLLIGDVIVDVEGTHVDNTNVYYSAGRLSGTPQTQVEIIVDRGGKLIELVLIRDSFAPVSVESFSQIDAATAYIRINYFSADTEKELKFQISRAKKAGAEKLILDIRNNAGGNITYVADTLKSLTSAGELFSKVFKEGLIDNKGKPAQPESFYSNGSSQLLMKTVILVNNYTYGTAELFAAVMRDANGALIIGEKTFGKGCEQEVINLADDTAIRITTSFYRLQSGDSYDGTNVGITPEIPVPMTTESAKILHRLSIEQDLQMQKALEELTKD